MKTSIQFGLAMIALVAVGHLTTPTMAQSSSSNSRSESKVAKKNKAIVDQFYTAVETQQFEVIKQIFAANAVQLIPYAPEGFPKRLEGSEAIYKQFSGLTANFSQMRFPRQIFATDDPNFVIVQFKGDIDVKGGGKYENDYLGTFTISDGKIVEYAEYFNPFVMAKAFGLKL